MSVVRQLLLRVVSSIVILVIVTPIANADTRLDSRVRPTFQSVVLDLDATKLDYSGSVKIELIVESAVDEFLFHAEEMSLDAVVLEGASGAIGVSVEEMEEHGLQRAKTDQTLRPGEYTLTIRFSKEYNTKSVGLYRMEFEGKGYLFTQFESIDARRAFPCWDEPNFKIPFQMTITIPMVQEVVTNTPVEKETIGATTRTIHFARTPPMPSYLLAIAAGPLESIAITGLSVPGRIYTCQGQKHLARLAVEVVPSVLDALEAYFGRPYPYKKLDFIGIPEYWPGAMENPGAVTFADRLLLIDSKAASVAQKRSLARVTAHELAHMWFGDLVTMAWWDDLWLNESFADWLGDKITDELYPEYEQGIAAVREVQRTLGRDARPSTKAIRKPVNSPSDIMEDLGLAYSKGKTVLKMVEMYVGEDNFQRGVRDYINANEWGSTVAADLFAALSTAAGMDLEPILSSFLDQPGSPLITVDVDDAGNIHLSQRRFSNRGVEVEPQTWTVPVRIKYSNGNEIFTRTVLLGAEPRRIETGTNVEWVMPDAGAYGYYRWSVPTDMLARVASDPLATLDKRERAAFIGNGRALLDAGEIGGDDYLMMLSSFAKAPDASTISQLLNALGSVQTAFVTNDLRDAFAMYVNKTLLPVLDRYGMDARDGEEETVSMVRPRLLAWLGDEGRHEGVREYCRQIAAKYMDDPTSTDPSVAGVALQVAAIGGSRDDYDRYVNKYETSKVPADKSRYLAAMGHFTDTEIQDAVLLYVAQGKVRPMEAFRVVGGVASTAEGRDKVFAWLMENYETITSRIPAEFAAYMPFFVSGCSAERLAAARVFFGKPGNSVDGTEANLSKVGDQVTDCVNLREREGNVVADYLNKFLSAN